MFEEHIGFKLHSRVRAHCTNLLLPRTKLHFSVLEILCVLDGSVIISDSFSDYLLQKDDLHIINPTYPYRIHEAESGKDATLLVVQIDLEYYKRFFPAITDSLYLTCTVDAPNRLFNEYLKYIRFLLAKIFFLYNEKVPNEGDLEAAARTLLSFLIQYFQHYAFQTDEQNNCRIVLNTQTRKSYDPNFVYEIINHIYSHFHEKIRLEDLAREKFLSAGYLSRYIKQVSGLTFCDHVSMARCERAEELLITTNKTIDEIASEVGFANRQHLTKQFSRWFRLTPARYRRAFRYADEDGSNEPPEVDYSAVLKILDSYLRQEV